MKRIIVMLVCISFMLNGCASMFHGTKETIHVRSEEPDTEFFIDSRKIGSGTTAVTTIRKKELSNVVLRAEKEGCHAKSSPVETQFDGISLLGILLDLGLISILVVDWAATGAITKAAQSSYILTPECA